MRDHRCRDSYRKHKSISGSKMGNERNNNQYNSENDCSYSKFFCNVLHFFLERRIFGDLFLGKICYSSKFGIHSCSEYYTPSISCCDRRSHPYTVIPFGKQNVAWYFMCEFIYWIGFSGQREIICLEFRFLDDSHIGGNAISLFYIDDISWY